MTFKYEYFRFILFITISISFAIDGSLPIRQDENTVYPNAEGHSDRMNAKSNQIKKRQDNVWKNSLRFTKPATENPNKVNMKEVLVNNEESNFTSNYDYEKNDISLDINKYNETQNDEKRNSEKNYNEIEENFKDTLTNNVSKMTSIDDGISTISMTDHVTMQSLSNTTENPITDTESPNKNSQKPTSTKLMNIQSTLDFTTHLSLKSSKNIKNLSILTTNNASKRNINYALNTNNSSFVKKSLSKDLVKSTTAPSESTLLNNSSTESTTQFIDSTFQESTKILKTVISHSTDFTTPTDNTDPLTNKNLEISSFKSSKAVSPELMTSLKSLTRSTAVKSSSSLYVNDTFSIIHTSSSVSTESLTGEMLNHSTTFESENSQASSQLTENFNGTEEEQTTSNEDNFNKSESTTPISISNQEITSLSRSLSSTEQFTNSKHLSINSTQSPIHTKSWSTITANRESLFSNHMTTLQSPIINNHTFPSLIKNNSISSPSHTLTTFTPPVSITTKVNSKIRKPTDRRVEISENELLDIYWICPPNLELLNDNSAEYEWYKVSSVLNNYTKSLSNKKDPITGKSVLEIKGISTGSGARYVCVNQKASLFQSAEMYFYQIVILQSKWINIGSTKTVSLYVNQRAIINCPYGNIIKNNVSVNGCCSSRISILENSLITKRDIYRCSDSNKTTIKIPATHSSINCSLALMGCKMKNSDSCHGNETDCTKNSNIINIDRCKFNNNSRQIIPRTPKTCPGQIHVRFYFDIFKDKCLPFETNICEDDFFSFQLLQECEETCMKIPMDIQNCFHPSNTDESDYCSTKKLKGKYLAFYDIENMDCKWFYYCGGLTLSKNVFQSISLCNQACTFKQKLIKIESIKACRYQDINNMKTIQSNISLHWSFNKQTETCEISSNNDSRIITFTTKKKCEEICRIHGSREICETRPDNGICQKQSITWHFNKQFKRCMKILDGGCGESLNRFDSKSSCEDMCIRLINQPVFTSSIYPMKVTKIVSTYKSITKIVPTYKSITKIRTNRSTVKLLKPTIRKRFHRRVRDQEMNSNKVDSIRSFDIIPVPKYFNVSDRKLDFDPCFKEAIQDSCDFGFNQNSYQMTRYTYKLKNGNCYKIQFSGCKSGENLFDDANDCKSSCEFRLHATLQSASCQNPFFHNCMAPDNVQNKKRLQRYFFLSSTNECVQFTSVDTPHCLKQYFESVKQCQQMCIPKAPSESMLQNRCFGKIVLWESSCSMDQKINRWFYMQNIDQCLQYSTCPVSYPGNTFHSKVECENSCKASNILTVCGLPVDTGLGELRKRKYFYNRQLGKCQLFHYKGSLGNLNRFNTKIECEKSCSATMEKTDEMKYSSLMSGLDRYKEYKGTVSNEAWLNENIDKEYCYDPHMYGGCGSNHPQIFIKKYYYDSRRKQCEPYMFSGCGAMSRNSFDSISICDKMCTERIARKTSSPCSQEVSKCFDSQLVYWIYNPERGVCEPFLSCIKQSNHQFFFTSKRHCTQSCAPALPLKKDLFDICHLPQSINYNCTEISDRWFYDQLTRSCKLVSSCDQYGNNFPSLTSCLAACEPDHLKIVCQLPVDKGPCDNNDTINYYFDWSTQTCKSFFYGGCLGNRNRFQTLMECQSVCPMKNQCNLKFNHPEKCDPLNLNPVSKIYHYDMESGRCKRIENFQCGDHTKFFPNEGECNKYCVVPMEFQLIAYKEMQNLTKWEDDICRESLLFNNYPLCTKFDEWLPRFYYDRQQDRCTFFYYNGCNGIEDRGNRFITSSICESKCRSHVLTTTTDSITKETTTILSVTVPFLTISTTEKELNNLAKKISNKPGLCPDSNYQCTQIQENSMKCESDNDCQNSWKCCTCETKYTILSMCVEPLSCMTTKHGCCADGVTFATDEHHLNCNKVRPTIDPSLPELIRYESDEDLILNCEVSGDPKPKITWIYLENTSMAINPDSINWDLIQPLWAGLIKIPLSKYSYGLWSCQTKNEVGLDEKEVYVYGPSLKIPFLRIHSFDANVKVSINATVNNKVILHCPIYGIPRPVINWFFNKIIINDSLWSLSIFNRHLVIDKIKFIHAGIWTCTAENKWGSISYKIRLRVFESIRIFPPLMGTTIKANQGQEIILFCNVQVEGYRSINWYWEIGKNKTKLNSTMESDSRILKVLSFKNQYLGNYVCEADNKFSSAVIKYTIVPYNSDEISVNPSGTVFVGTTIVLECPIKLSEKVTHVMWKKDNMLMTTKSAELKLVLRSKLDSGFYSCLQNNRNYLTYLSVYDIPPSL